MATLPKNEGPRQSDWLVFEECDITRYSRENIVVVAGSGVLPTGTVLGKVTASGKYGVYDNAATNGTEVAAAILAEAVDATTVDVRGAAVVRLAKIAPGGLTWKTSLNSADKTAGLADLALNGIHTVREV